MTFAAVQAYGGIQQGRAARRQANAEADEMDRQAAYERAIAQGEAAQIRRAGDTARGATLGALAASGVVVGEGSALDAERQVMTDYAQDEAITLLTGEQRASSLRASADNRRRSGRDARRAANVGAVTSLLSAGVQSARAAGWRQYGPGFSGGQAPAPVEQRSPWSSSGPTFRARRGQVDS